MNFSLNLNIHENIQAVLSIVPYKVVMQWIGVALFAIGREVAEKFGVVAAIMAKLVAVVATILRSP